MNTFVKLFYKEVWPRLKLQIQEMMAENPSTGGGGTTYLSSEFFQGTGATSSDPIKLKDGLNIGSGSGSSAGANGTTSDVTFGPQFVNTAGVMTNPNGPSYHQEQPAQQVIPAGKKGRVWVKSDNVDSDFILGINTTGTGNYTTFVDSFQLSYFQSNQRVLKWVSNTQTFVKNTVVKYAGIQRDVDGTVTLQESFDGVTWVDIDTLAPMTGNVFIMLSMTNNGKTYNPKLTIY